MEKICEFCKALRPVVYCAADAAHLCLSCDAKVHSANALSYRHSRTLVCESCRYQPVYVRCFEHQMFICQNCDASFHVSFQHHRKEVSSYVGSPSVKDLAALWGFDLNQLENRCFAKTRSDSNAQEISGLVSGGSSLVFDEGSSSRGTKVTKDDSREPNTSLIVQQILALEKLQFSRTIENSHSIHVKDHQNGPSLKKEILWKMEHDTDSPNDNSIEELLSPPFSQLDNLTSTGNSQNGDLLWQWKSPAHNNEIWLHNMQDIGVCDEVQCFDDDNTPDIDLTFRNFEELFGSDQEPSGAMVDNDENTTQLGIFDMRFASTVEKFNDEEKRSHPLAIKPSYSASSFSFSRITGERSGFEYNENGSCDTESSRLDDKENVMKRYKEKKILRHEKQSRYASHKSKFDGQK